MMQLGRNHALGPAPGGWNADDAPVAAAPLLAVSPEMGAG